MQRDRIESFVFFGLFALVATLLFFVFTPFIHVLTLAAVLAILLHAPHEKLARLFHNRSVAAGSMTLLALVFMVVPLFLLGNQLFVEAQGAYAQAQGGAQYITSLQNTLTSRIHQVLPHTTINLEQYVASVFGSLTNNLGSFVSQTALFVFNTFLMLLAFFFFLRDGKKFTEGLTTSSPLGGVETERILDNAKHAILAIIKGTLLVALIRFAIIAGAFYVFHIPNAMLWGTFAGVIGAVPGVGTLLVFAAATLFVYVHSGPLLAAGMALVGVLVSMLVDNMLTPYFFGRGLMVPQLFVLFAILGGVLFFGPIGFIFGPLILSVFVSLLSVYQTNSTHKD